jgi:mannosyltransferase
VFALSLAAALYTHNWAVFLALMSAVAFLVCVRERPDARRALWRDGALAFGGVLVLYAPWVPTVLYQAKHTGAPWDLPPVIWSLSQGMYSLVGGRGAAIALLLGGGGGLLALRLRRDELRLSAVSLLLLGAGTLLIAWLYSKVTPAWAPRYLAVIVGPLILLFGLGIARSGRLGMFALVLTACFWLLDPVPKTRDWKSNVASAVAAVRPELGSQPLVLSTQPEQVPTLAYYLPGVRRFGTPLGSVPDPRVVDWRGALARLRRSSVRRVLLPMLSTLRPGQRVLLVVPTSTQKQPMWLRLIAHDSDAWSNVLAHDPALRFVKTATPNSRPSGLPVRATVYVRR